MQSNKRLIFLLGDVVLFYGALWIALGERQGRLIGEPTWDAHWPAFTIVLILWLIVFYINDLYTIHTVKRGPILMNKIMVSMAINFTLGALFFYLTIHFLNIKPQTILLLTAINYSILLYIWRQLITTVFGSQTFKNTVVFIGNNQIVEELIKTIHNEPQLGYAINAIIDRKETSTSEIPRYEISEQTLKTVLYNHKIDTIVVTTEQYKNQEVVSALYKLISPSITIISLPAFYEELTGKIPLNQIEHAWALEHLSVRQNHLFNIVKKMIDIILSIIVGMVAILIAPLTALALFIEQPKSPIIFTQRRVGYLGKEYKHIKFRSMTEVNEPSGRAEWSSKNNARVTRVGKFIRKTRIDELPQILNVLKGDMSFIGPRPERPEFTESLLNEIPFYKDRLLVKPGLTGWAQVEGPAYGGSKKESLEKLQYDLYYIKNRSLGLELSVMLKTIRTLLAFKGQ